MKNIRDFLQLELSDILNRRAEVYGICAIWIVCFHLTIVAGMDTSNIMLRLINKAFSIGASSVDIFLFYSGVGVYYSMNKHSIADYYKNRLHRLFLPWTIIAGAYFIWYEICHKGSFLNVILKISTIYWWIDDVLLWFVPALVVLYLVYPFLFLADRRTNNKGSIVFLIASIIVIILLSIYNAPILDTRFEKLISRIPFFLLGSIVAEWAQKHKHYKVRGRDIIAITALLCIGVFVLKKYTSINYTAFYRWFKATFVAFVVFLYLYLTNVWECSKPICAFTSAIGRLSLEVYLSHLCLLYAFKTYSWWEEMSMFFRWVLVLVCTVVVIAVYKLICKGLSILLRTKKQVS